MARQPRFEYPGAVYHVMARGDGGKPIFVGKDDRESFLDWLERVCTSQSGAAKAQIAPFADAVMKLEAAHPQAAAYRPGSIL